MLFFQGADASALRFQGGTGKTFLSMLSGALSCETSLSMHLLPTYFVFFFFLVNLRLATRLFGIDFLLLLFGGAVEAVRVELGLEAEHALAQLQVHVRQPLVLGLEVRDRLLLVGELLHVQRLRQTDLLVGLAQLVLQRRDKLRTF